MPATPAWPPKSLPRLFVRESLREGASIELDSQQANYLGNVLRLGVGAELGADSEDDLTRALRRGSQDTINQTGQQIVRRQLNVQPTLTIRPGHPLRVVLTRDLVLEPIGATR